MLNNSHSQREELAQNVDSEKLDAELTPLNAPLASRDFAPRSLAARQNQSALTVRSTRRVPAFLYAVAPAALFLALGIAARRSDLPQPLTGERSSTRSLSFDAAPVLEGESATLLASQTLVVPQSARKSVVWRTRLQPAIDVIGRAPVAGQISRVWVQSGQNVEVGDRVMRIISYQRGEPVVQYSAPTRSNFNRDAENEQVAAVRAQGKLSQRLSSAQEQLRAAQARVGRAQTRVNQAMSIVQKLQSGAASDEYVEEDVKPRAQDGASAARVQAAQSSAERASSAAQKAEENASQAAREASRAEANAERKTRRAAGLSQTRERELSKIAAAASASSAAASSSEAATGGENTESAPPKISEKPPVPSVSIGEIESAENEARQASSEASSLRSQARKSSSVANSARSRAQSAGVEAKEALRSLRLFSDDEEKPRRSRPRREANLPSIEEASRLVKSASEESRAANREAERWKNEVDEYSNQAKSTRSRIEASEQNLSSAQQDEQQRTLESTLERNLSIVRAPASGTVVQVNGVGDDVSFGDPIIMVGKSGSLRARFTDTSGLWRTLKPGARLTATVQTRAKNTPSTRSSAQLLPDTAQVSARVESVDEPQASGQPAVVRAVVAPFATVPSVASSTVAPSTDATSAAAPQSPSTLANNVAVPNATAPNATAPTVSTPSRRLRLRSGMIIECALNSPTNALVLKLPSEAVVPLPQVSNSSSAGNAAISAASTDAVSSTPNLPDVKAASQRGLVAVLKPDADGAFRIEWREILFDNGALQERLVSGLIAGERVALPAVRLRALVANNDDMTRIRLR